MKAEEEINPISREGQIRPHDMDWIRTSPLNIEGENHT